MQSAFLDVALFAIYIRLHFIFLYYISVLFCYVGQ